MDMADYSEALDPAYTTLEFENMQVLPLGTGESHWYKTQPMNFETFTDLKLWPGRGRSECWREVIKKKGSFCPPVAPRSGTVPVQWSAFITPAPDSKPLRDFDLRGSALSSGHLVKAL